MISDRLKFIVDALPLRPGCRILEIGCGPGAMAREMAKRIEGGFVLGIDRSAKAISAAIQGSQAEISAGTLSFRHVAVEDFTLLEDEASFDIAVAIRVGALDGRHPKSFDAARSAVKSSLVDGGAVFIDGGNPLRSIPLRE